MTRVLIIDDDIDFLEVIDGLLRMSGFDIVDRGNNGKEAVELYKQHQPDVVLLDILMPVYDGMYAIKNILTLYPDAKIIAVTAMYDGIIAENIQKNNIPILRKPFSIDELKTVVSTHLK